MELLYLGLGCTVTFFLIFIILYRRNKASLASGFWFTCFLLAAGGTLVFWGLEAGSRIVAFLMYALSILAVLVLLFGVYVLVALLLFNARAMFRREKRSLANALTLLVALGIIALLVFSAVSGNLDLPRWWRILEFGFGSVLAYYVFHLYLFFVSLLLCNFARPRKVQEYIVVLGAGLKEGKVSPLLARRVDKAIGFYHKQAKKRRPPKLVMSGGQGADEPRPEAEAMAEYAREKGVPEEDILLETRSVNTMQNMAFSKEVMDADSHGLPYKSIFASNNYHLLRGAVYARKAGIPMDGISCRTALYYLPTALLREYIAFLVLYLRTHLIVAAVLFALGAGGRLIGFLR